MRFCSPLLAILVALSGCSKRSEKFCLMNPLDERCDPPDSTGVPCDAQNPCTVGVCENNICVECTAADDSECMDATPVCNVTTNACVACSLHSECDSEACLPSGACGTDTTVAYVAADGAPNGVCTFEMPCNTVSDGLARGRDFVKIVGTITESVVINNRDVTILAEPGAILQPMTGMNALTIDGTSDVIVYDLTITGGSSGGRGVVGSSNMATTTLHRVTVDSNAGGGISMTAGSLTVSSSTISQNSNGGISTDNGVQFDITNSFIFKNGNTTSTNFGGVKLGVPGPVARFEFNTVADNRAIGGFAAGLQCSGMTLNTANNIIAGNVAGTTPNQHTTGQCGILTSRVQDNLDGLNFEEPDTAPLSFKLMAGSNAIDQAITPSDIMVDFEGDPRPAGAVDLGADEFTP